MRPALLLMVVACATAGPRDDLERTHFKGGEQVEAHPAKPALQVKT